MASVFLLVIACHCSESRPARSTTGVARCPTNLVRSSSLYLFKNTNARRTMTISCFHHTIAVWVSIYIYAYILYIYISLFIKKQENEDRTKETEWATCCSNDSTSLTFSNGPCGTLPSVSWDLSAKGPGENIQPSWGCPVVQPRSLAEREKEPQKSGVAKNPLMSLPGKCFVNVWDPLVSRSFGWQSMRKERRSAEEQSAYWMAAIHYKENTLTGRSIANA